MHLEAELEDSVREHFVKFFASHDYTKDSISVVSRNVSSLADVEAAHYGTGVYLILTDYQANENK